MSRPWQICDPDRCLLVLHHLDSLTYPLLSALFSGESPTRPKRQTDAPLCRCPSVQNQGCHVSSLPYSTLSPPCSSTQCLVGCYSIRKNLVSSEENLSLPGRIHQNLDLSLLEHLLQDPVLSREKKHPRVAIHAHLKPSALL